MIMDDDDAAEYRLFMMLFGLHETDFFIANLTFRLFCLSFVDNYRRFY